MKRSEAGDIIKTKIFRSVPSIKISVAKQFGTRLSKAEAKDFCELLNEKLKTAIRYDQLLIVDLDGAIGYSDNFLENSFGTVCRMESFDSIQILGYLHFTSSDPELMKKIQQIIGDAIGWPRFVRLYWQNTSYSP
jgi:hypothetical protein